MLKRRGQSWRALLLLGATVWFQLVAHAEPARWDVDPDHSTIEFRVTHMVVSKTTGRFMDYAGFIDMDAEAGTVKAIEATIKTGSVNTNHEKRDAHLRNADFFDVEHYPTMTFKLKRYKKTAEGYTAAGDLTLRGVTKEITLVGHYNGTTKDPMGNTRAGFNAEGKLNRKDFGMVWNKTLDSGGLVVGDEVQIRLDIECIKAKP
ncbi:MAG: YceI family protein [Nitrospirae bacterium]|nr:YceI family protein [Nitrospirota bacterium]MDE3040861.1 YceI family protein [Nitrospirota bacterium]MDE3221012.1 YceI family protein [Nitrospirota bacterium]